MKTLKHLGLALLMAVPMLLSSCSNNDTPQVSITVDLAGCAVKDGNLYVVQGDILTVKSLTAVPEPGTPEAAICNAYYYWDFRCIGATRIAPFGIHIDSAFANIGEHLFEIKCTVAQVDKALGTGYIGYKVFVVKSKEDIPEGAQIFNEPTNVSVVVTTDTPAE